jgi:hypothetical protein
MLEEFWRYLRRQRHAVPRLSSVKQSSRVSLQTVVLRGTPEETQDIVVRRVGWPDEKVRTEVEAVRRFCHGHRCKLVNVHSSLSQHDDADVAATSADGLISEQFQVTRLWDSRFWQKLNTSGAVDTKVTSDQLVGFVREALQRKEKYPRPRRKQLILLLDTEPYQIQPHSALRGPELRAELLECEFKQIWIVGPNDSTQLA